MGDASKPKRSSKSGLCQTPFRPERRATYLSVLQATGEKVLARAEVGVHGWTVSKLRESDPKFREAEEEAMRLYRAGIAEEIHRRAIDGVKEPIYWQGKVVGWIVRYSDTLLKFHAKRHIPEYRDSLKIDQKTAVSGSVDLRDLRDLPPEEREILEAAAASLLAVRKARQEEEEK